MSTFTFLILFSTVPNSSSFLRSRGNEGQQPAIAKKPTEIHGSSSATTKPVPPQKNLEKLTPKINTNGPNRPSTTMARTPKPRPLSHYEPLGTLETCHFIKYRESNIFHL